MESRYVQMFSGVTVGRNSGSTRPILFVDFGVEAKVGSMGLENNKVGGCGGEIARGDEIRNSSGRCGQVFSCEVMLKG